MAIITENTNTSVSDFKAKGLLETGGTVLAMGAVTDGEFLKRVGSTIVSAAGGGGGLTEFTEAETSAAPNETVVVNSLTVAAATTDADVALVAKGTGATLAQIPENTAAGGDKRGTYATDWQKSRIVNTEVASGPFSTISGGSANTANAEASTVGGGQTNTASGYRSTVSGGWTNTANQDYTTVGGGRNHTASAACATVAGGYTNTASATYCTVGGGGNNTASSYSYATVSGGSGNTASGAYSTIGGGFSNAASGSSSTIGGGGANAASATYSTVAGGGDNTAEGTYSTISGGRLNTASGAYSAIGGGYTNAASAAYSTVAGGGDNTASGGYSAIGGGYTNAASATYSTVVGGLSNTASAHYSTVVGGQGNTASGYKSFIGGGKFNTASGNYSFIGGGYGNTASASYATISGGCTAVAALRGQHTQNSFVFGAVGDAQTSVLTLGVVTTDDTQTELSLDGTTTPLRLAIASDTTWVFEIYIVARRTDADNESAGYKIEGVIDNNTDTTALVGSIAKTVLAEDTAAWDVTAAADDTNDALIIQVTGEDGKTIRWVARVTLTEVTG